ncbi:MAG: 2-C-methyl-D-erythritol 2,4-cyclodiphosphate synthase [Acidimicrobiales bacterium]|jgi:2-C-methyl-D-erythritol 2,4-cyclodiphosphate synthase|nr:2-C-methyl-D-erythritol 2,4-cyclodiphosphate synthase [Acidimicrobiales bacterium]MDG1846899.1 2-C-methyl-D-erythritol 2,4-cyclodiphosphate synthase [Acidimicrobiales bacterium]
MMRIGHGFDSHGFTDDPNRPLILGGVEFESGLSLAGHSDADVVAHACADALLGPTKLGDIGTVFPDTDPQYENANSIDLLRYVATLIAKDGWEIINIDCSVIAEHPTIQPNKKLMESNLSEAIGAPVTLKGKSTEGFTDFNGILCYAMCLLSRADG